uniref:Reverse transcriptase domain-containing protein n=1 Tax=Tanacetum cinerariifolium TaxID=118510 RepID=A0A6L2N4Y2_TANCI|nr:reverse transcriptase domain-containing protein [Tanacetum cinerariifolium]
MIDCGPIKLEVKRLFGGIVRAMMSPAGSIVASLENVNGFLSVNTSSDDLIRTDFEQEGVVPKGIDFREPIPSSRGNKYILVAVDYLSKWVEAKGIPTNDARVVCKFLKSLFGRFGTPCAIISDRGTYFCNDQFTKFMLKYGVTHCLATAYHP